MRNKEMKKLLLRPTEAAEVIGLGRSKMYELLAKGIVPSIKIGKSVRVPVEGLRAWIKKQTSNADASAEDL
jgi:excisionase family DNA binding protein